MPYIRDLTVCYESLLINTKNIRMALCVNHIEAETKTLADIFKLIYIYDNCSILIQTSQKVILYGTLGLIHKEDAVLRV